MINEEFDITTLDLKKSLLLFSGGLDTTTLLYLLVDEGIPVQCLGFDYGQQAKHELECAKKTCEKLNIKYEIIDLNSLNISGDLGKGGNIANKTDIIIPNRNSIFLAIGTNYAIKNGCDNIYIGSKLGQDACLDEQPDFIEQYNALNMVSDITPVYVKAPFINYSLEEVITLALDLEVPLEDTWSCFGEGDKRCGKCGNCTTIPEVVVELINQQEKQLKNLKKFYDSFSISTENK